MRNIFLWLVASVNQDICDNHQFPALKTKLDFANWLNGSGIVLYKVIETGSEKKMCHIGPSLIQFFFPSTYLTIKSIQFKVRPFKVP